MPNVVTVREAVQRAKADGLPVTEYTLRRWIKTGAIPVRSVGSKALLFYPNLVNYLQCGNGLDYVQPTLPATPGIRRADM